MRIDGLSQVSQVYKTGSARKVYQANTSYAKDEFSISSFAKDLQVAKAALSEAPDVRADKVSALKEAYEAGTYNVSSQAIADKLVSKAYDSIF